MKLKNYFGIIASRNYDRSFGFGLNVYIHRHYINLDSKEETKKWPKHFHFCLTFLFWFIELRIGKDYLGEE